MCDWTWWPKRSLSALSSLQSSYIFKYLQPKLYIEGFVLSPFKSLQRFVLTSNRFGSGWYFLHLMKFAWTIVFFEHRLHRAGFMQSWLNAALLLLVALLSIERSWSRFGVFAEVGICFGIITACQEEWVYEGSVSLYRTCYPMDRIICSFSHIKSQLK